MGSSNQNLYGAAQPSQPQPESSSWGANSDPFAAPAQPYSAGNPNQPVTPAAYGQAYPQQPGAYPQQGGQYPQQMGVSGAGDVDSVGSWMLALFIASIPIVGFIYILSLAFGSTQSRARQNWARAMFYLMLIAFGIVILLSVATGSFFGGVFSSISD